MKPSELLKERGWCQGVFEDLNGRLCLFEAISQACSEDEFFDASRKIREKIGEDLIPWNDEHNRTQEEVINLLEGLNL